MSNAMPPANGHTAQYPGRNNKVIVHYPETGGFVRRMEAFEIWLWRKMEKISCKDTKTNEEVL